MLSINLERFGYTPFGTFGTLYLPEFQCYTIERPWINNEPKISCIPEGEYSMRFTRFFRGGYDTYQLEGVPDRTLIKIHIGNVMDDLLGCIAPGLDLGWYRNKWAVTNSTKAFKAFMQAMGGAKSAKIIITHKEI